VRAWPQAIPWSKQRRTAKIRHVRLFSLCCWVKTGAIGAYFLRAPTIVAWDLSALCRILPIEARSP
jgi:hypothetical protein